MGNARANTRDAVPQRRRAGRLRGASLLQLYPDRRSAGPLVARHQPATLAAMEALFDERRRPRPLVIVGQPNMADQPARQPHRRAPAC